MTGWVFPVRLFHSRLFAGFQRRTKASVNPSASRRLRAYADAPDSVDPSLIHRAPWPRPRLPSLEGWARTTNYRPTAVPVTTPGVGPPRDATVYSARPRLAQGFRRWPMPQPLFAP